MHNVPPHYWLQPAKLTSAMKWWVRNLKALWHLRALSST